MTRTATVEGRDRLRLFCGLRLPAGVAERIVAWQLENLSGGRITPPDHLHITLAFLGSCPADQLPLIAAELREAASKAEQPRFSFRRYRETPRVGMLVFEDERDGTAHGQALAYDVQARMERLGITLRERRPWSPHVTVMRFKEPPRLRPPEPDLGTFSPSDAAVYHSALSPAGAQYSVLESAPLGG
jgi:RNA 2',3'-cyclic 3'-phosphodiesterase